MEQIFDLRLEQHLLSGVLRNPFIFPEVEGIVSELDFKNQLHKTIWNQIKQSLRAGESIDSFFIAQKINNLSLSFEDKITSVADYLEGLCLINVKKDTIKQIANELRTISIRREIAHTGQEISKAMYQHSNYKADEIVTLSNQIYSKVINSFKPNNEPVDLFRGAEDYIHSLEDDLPSDEIACPYNTYQSFFGGFFPGDLTLFASPPKNFKSTLLMDIIRKVSENKNHNIKALIVDTELETYRVQRRIVSAISGVNEYMIKSKKWKKNKIADEKVQEALIKMRDFWNKIEHIYVGNITTEEMISIVKRWHWKNINKDNKALVAIDYFKLTSKDEKITDAYASSMTLGVRVDMFKKLASELQVPIIAAVQTNRQNEVGLSYEVNKFASSVFKFERKTKEEMERDNFDATDKDNATHKLMPLYTRDLGEKADEHNEYVKLFDHKHKKEVFVPNYISFKIHNFNVIEMGDLRHIINIRENKLNLAKRSSDSHKIDLI